jgi:hypothetical protein
MLSQRTDVKRRASPQEEARAIALFVFFNARRIKLVVRLNLPRQEKENAYCLARSG